MLDVAQYISDALQQPSILEAVAGGINWELAEEGTPYPFINFSFKGGSPVTKEGLRDQEVFIRIFGRSLTEGATIAGIVQEALKGKWRDRGNRSGYTDTEEKEAFIELTYHFKH